MPLLILFVLMTKFKLMELWLNLAVKFNELQMECGLAHDTGVHYRIACSRVLKMA